MRTDLILLAGILAADRLTKALVPWAMNLHDSFTVVPGLFSITYVRNTGGAFGILAGWESPLRRAFFIAASFAALALLAYMYRDAVRASLRPLRLALVAVASGAVGNLYDRLTTGEVVDFLDAYVGTHHWPAFNVADSAITVGSVVLAFLFLTDRTENRPGPGQGESNVS